MMVVGAALSPAPFPPQDFGTGDAVVAQKSPLFLLGSHLERQNGEQAGDSMWVFRNFFSWCFSAVVYMQGQFLGDRSCLWADP